ncbi:MAG: hypothetical protein C0407_10070 [Desulfobacca sp.]|nr:hypothetical protein [Desulfobacca sp.]
MRLEIDFSLPQKTHRRSDGNVLFFHPETLFRFLDLESKDLSQTFYQESGGFIFGPVDFVDLNKRLPKEAGVVHPYAMSFFAEPNLKLGLKNRPTPKQEIGSGARPTRIQLSYSGRIIPPSYLWTTLKIKPPDS